MFGFRDALGAVVFRKSGELFARVHRRHRGVILWELSQRAASMVSDDTKLLAGMGVDEHSRQVFLKEYETLQQELSRRVNSSSAYPDFFGVRGRSGYVMYALTRFFRPRTVLETGVANGHSTHFLLHALRENGDGQLHSIDIANDVGGLLTPEERQSWHLHVLDVLRPEASLREILQGLPPVDLFLQDSDHTYHGVWREFSAVWSHISAHALLASDDTDYSWAFADFCREHHLPVHILFDGGKLLGLTRLNGNRESS